MLEDYESVPTQLKVALTKDMGSKISGQLTGSPGLGGTDASALQ